MDAKSMTRKEFIRLSFTVVGSAVTVAACGTSSVTAGDAGTGAAGTGGIGGAGGVGGAGGAAGAAGQGGTGGTTTAACTSPLPEVQDADLQGHIHFVTIDASVLNATVDQVFQTSAAAAQGQTLHTHQITLTPTDLAAIKAGGSVDVQSSLAQSHTHNYTISCH